MADLPKPGTPVPPVPGPLSPAQMQQAADWINAKALDPADPCQVCGGTSTIQPSTVAMPGGLHPSTGTSGWVHPCIVTICEKCGYQRYFNAIIMGVLPEYRIDFGNLANG